MLELLLHDIRKKYFPYKDDVKNMYEFETNIALDQKTKSELFDLHNKF